MLCVRSYLRYCLSYQLMTKVRVLHLFANSVPEVIPTALGQEEKELIGAGASSAGRRRSFSRLFGFYPADQGA